MRKKNKVKSDQITFSQTKNILKAFQFFSQRNQENYPSEKKNEEMQR